MSAVINKYFKYHVRLSQGYNKYEQHFMRYPDFFNMSAMSPRIFIPPCSVSSWSWSWGCISALVFLFQFLASKPFLCWPWVSPLAFLGLMVSPRGLSFVSIHIFAFYNHALSQIIHVRCLITGGSYICHYHLIGPVSRKIGKGSTALILAVKSVPLERHMGY